MSRLVLVAAMTALLVVVAGIIVYPLFASSVFQHFRPRSVGAVLLVASLGSLALPARGAALGIQIGRWPVLGMALLGAAATLLDRRAPLLLVPSLAWAAAASVFWNSLSDETPVMERFVQWIHPYKPDFVSPYLRKLTRAWAWFLGAHALALAGLVLLAPEHWWETYTSWVMLPSMLLFTAVEYVVRKTAFRYYPYGGPIDRLFSTFFPAEETEMGRRSQAYIEARARALRGEADPG